MEDNTPIPLEYQKRFNEGYTIAKYMPDLAQQLAQAMKGNERSTGFQEGRQQYLSEQVKGKLPSWLSGERSAKSEQQPDKSKDRDIEPELD